MVQNVQKIVGGITPKGTIFIRELGEKGNVLRKRVVKGEMQYDAKMKQLPEKGCSQVLITDWKEKGQQTLQLMPKKIGRVKGFFLKLFGADLKTVTDGKYLANRESIPFVESKERDVLYEGYVKMVQDKTGFSDMGMNREMALLKTQLNVKGLFQKIRSEATARQSFPQGK